MPPPRIPASPIMGLASSLRALSIARPSPSCLALRQRPSFPPIAPSSRLHPQRRALSTTRTRLNWLQPNIQVTYKHRKGRPRVPTGGSVRGTTVVYGDYGLRLRDHDRRISAKQLRIGEEVIRRRLRGHNFRFFSRVHAGVGVFTKGNESRMGTGKGKFDYWAVRVPISKVVFEVKADCHEQVIQDALRLAGNKLPGLWEFVRKDDPPVMGITKLGPETSAADLMRPRKKLPLEETAQRLQSSSS